MATPRDKLAKSLEKLKAIQDRGLVAIKASDLTRGHRERLVKNGFIREVIKGWYLVAPHDAQKGDTTFWYSSFWGFCSRYLEDRYGDDYCVSAEQSLMLHAGNNAVPTQLIIRSSKGNNSPTALLFGTSLFVMKSPLPNIAEIEEKHGIRIVNLPASIVHSTPSIFTRQAIEVRTALLMIKDASGGYPWTVIPVEERDRYMNALEDASFGQDIKPFAKYLAYLVGAGLKGEPIAK